MDIATGREFSFVNPQDDPELYPNPPDGFTYNIDGKLVGIPKPLIQNSLNREAFRKRLTRGGILSKEEYEKYVPMHVPNYKLTYNDFLKDVNLHYGDQLYTLNC